MGPIGDAEAASATSVTSQFLQFCVGSELGGTSGFCGGVSAGTERNKDLYVELVSWVGLTTAVSAQ